MRSIAILARHDGTEWASSATPSQASSGEGYMAQVLREYFDRVVVGGGLPWTE
jgi:hypothetical protein